MRSKSVASDSFRQLKILRHDGNSLSMNGTKVGILEKGDKVSLSSFLQSEYSLTLESNFLFPLLSNLTDHPLEWQFSDQKIGLNYERNGKRRQQVVQ